VKRKEKKRIREERRKERRAKWVQMQPTMRRKQKRQTVMAAFSDKTVDRGEE